MEQDSAQVIRTRAELARRLASQMANERARQDLLDIADGLETEAAKIEKVARSNEE